MLQLRGKCFVFLPLMMMMGGDQVRAWPTKPKISPHRGDERREFDDAPYEFHTQTAICSTRRRWCKVEVKKIFIHFMRAAAAYVLKCVAYAVGFFLLLLCLVLLLLLLFLRAYVTRERAQRRAGIRTTTVQSTSAAIYPPRRAKFSDG